MSREPPCLKMLVFVTGSRIQPTQPCQHRARRVRSPSQPDSAAKAPRCGRTYGSRWDQEWVLGEGTGDRLSPKVQVEPSRGYAAAFLSPDALLGSERHCEDASTKAESTTRDLVLAELSRGQFAHRKCLSRIPACFRRANSFSDSQPGVTSSDAASA